MIEGVVGVVIWTEDLETLVEFYREMLGLTPHSVRRDFVAFRWNEMRLSIGKHSEVRGRSGEPYRVMVNLGVSDIQRLHRELTAKGVPFLRPPEQEHWGGWVATLSDPDGNTLHLIQQPPERLAQT